MILKIDKFSGKYRWLNNFSESKVIYLGLTYPTVEHAYQAAKTLIDEEIEAIRTAPTPAIAKKLGKHVTLRDNWEDIKLEIMTDLLLQKFSKDPFRTLLKNTGDSELIEGNTWGDIFWGVCNSYGKNYLGLILMEIRTCLNSIDETI